MFNILELSLNGAFLTKFGHEYKVFCILGNNNKALINFHKVGMIKIFGLGLSKNEDGKMLNNLFFDSLDGHKFII